jgi:hypothetical protein
MTKERTRLDKAFEDIFEELLKGKHTINIGEVTSFQKTKPPKASVQIVLKRLFEGEDEARLVGILDDCPIIYPGAGDWWLTFDLKVGSNVLILYNERSIEDWLDQGGIIEPSKTRTFSESDAIIIAGILPDPDNFDSIDDDCISLRKKDNSLFLKLFNGGITARLEDMDLEITKDEVKAKPTTTIPISTDIKIYNAAPVPPAPGYVSLLNHVHTGGTLAGGFTGPPQAITGPP